MKIEVKGHSGCQIDVVREDGKLYIYKSTRDLHYLDRLQFQAKKQQAALGLELQHIRVPRIYEVRRDSNSVTIKMEYIYSKNFLGYFEYAGFEQIAYFIKALRIFLDYEICHSPIQIVKKEVLWNKYEDVSRKILCNESLKDDRTVQNLLSKSKDVFSKVTDMRLPVGLCHGDLTFSNIMFNGNNYFLIDFLDSFIESPLLDIVKIRQDSAFLWSQLMILGDYDKIRLQIVANKLDQEIVSYASQFEWYSYYPYMQLMNFLRVLQYAHEEKVITYLKRIIEHLLYEF